MSPSSGRCPEMLANAAPLGRSHPEVPTAANRRTYSQGHSQKTLDEPHEQRAVRGRRRTRPLPEAFGQRFCRYPTREMRAFQSPPYPQTTWPAHTTDKTCKTPIGIYAGRWFERFCRFRGRLRHCTGRSCRLSNYSMPPAVRTPSTVAAVQTQPTKLALFCRKVVLQVLSVALAALRVLPLISIEIYVPRPSAPTASTSVSAKRFRENH